MTKFKLIFVAGLVFCVPTYAAEPAKKAEPAPKVVVKKPCKEGQDPKKDNCHELKKVEKKTPNKK